MARLVQGPWPDDMRARLVGVDPPERRMDPDVAHRFDGRLNALPANFFEELPIGNR
jgi:hypothetical protein